MAGTSSDLTGPDLSAGVELATLKDGAPLLGHAGGEAVILVRRGDEVFAIGATCTHYGGPLAEGLVVGDTVRCPWHHAAFCLRTGAPLRPPALNPVDCFEVVREGGRVRVAARRQAPAPARQPDEAPASVVIVGGGPAGQVAAETLRNEGYQGPITIFSADAAPPVDRPNLSKDYLAGHAPEEWIPLRPPEFYAERGIELRLAARVTGLDTAAREIALESGERVGYGALLLATGAEPIRLPTPGADGANVHYLRTLADSRAIIAAAESESAVVVGASFIGLEVAASLRTRGLEVHVVAPEEVPMARVLGEALGRMIRELHEEHGVRFHLGQTVAAIEPGSARLSGGGSLPATLVVMGVGVRPATALAEQAGLRLDRGVVVDEHLQTSAPGVYAAGDIARWPDPHTGEAIRVEHFVVAERQGRTAALNILGRQERYEDAPFFWSMHYDVGVNYVGHAEGFDEARVEGDLAARDAKVSYLKNGRVLAVATVGRDLDNLAAEVALEGEAVRR